MKLIDTGLPELAVNNISTSKLLSFVEPPIEGYEKVILPTLSDTGCQSWVIELKLGSPLELITVVQSSVRSTFLYKVFASGPPVNVPFL